MTKYEELKALKITTKAQLLEAIAKLPDDVILCGRDADIGGYDMSEVPYVTVTLSEQDGKSCVTFGHLEYEAYKAYQRGLITYEQSEEFSS